MALIERKNIETELLKLLKWSHEESLKTVEEYQRRERSYEQAIVAYQKRIAEMLKDTRTADLEKDNRALTATLASLEADLAAAKKRAEDAAAQSAAAKAELDSRVAAASADAARAALAAAAAQTAATAVPVSQSEKIARLLAVKAGALAVKEVLLERLGAEKTVTEDAK